MKKLMIVALLPLVVASAAVAQTEAEMQAAMEKWVAMGTPGAPHQMLAKLEGTWEAKVKMWMDPAAPPEESAGSSVNKMILGGRWLQQEYTGSMMGQPFHGMGYTGYDNYKKQYVGTWMDTASTSVMNMAGTMDAAGKVMTCTGSMDDCITGAVVQMRETLTIVDDNHHTMEMWATGPDGKEFKNMEISYSRKM